MRFEAEDNVWEELIQARPSATKWRVNTIRRYDLMGVVFRPLDKHVELNQNMEYIPKEPIYPGFTNPTPPSPPSVDDYSLCQTQYMPSVPFGGTTSSRGSKRKAPMVDKISNMAERQVIAMENRNEILSKQTEILRRTPTFTYTKGDIYEMLSAMNISDESFLERCYDFLCGNPTCTKRLMGVPPHKRWNKLCKMMMGAPTYVRPSVVEILDQRRFFSGSHQMEHYATDFYTRNIVRPFYPDLTKVFYSHMRISRNGYLLSELNVAHIKYEGQKLCYANIPYDFPYDHEMALATMTKPEMQGQRVKTVGFLIIHDRLLPYVIVHMLTPRPGNFANICLNARPMDDTPLPYVVLITQIMQYSGVYLDVDASNQMGTMQYFSTNSLKRLNIVNVYCVWQHDVGDDEDKEPPQHHSP
ncbi:hypothetical protein V8G54_010224 [Vigna mungo]|uniref:Uncharacterized protein n=1 Tax=Vigna mungo TaxID=3915 RepID=A0AAQ3NYP7_VIGMU